jgi:hypothetical protein
VVMSFAHVPSRGELDVLPRNKWGIPEPVDDGICREEVVGSPPVDVVILPGLGFDCSGRRLGRGKGFYGQIVFCCFCTYGVVRGLIYCYPLALGQTGSWKGCGRRVWRAQSSSPS